jgi:hypothetical protein
MAMTGYFYTFTRPRTSLPMSMIKYDPISTNRPPLFRTPLAHLDFEIQHLEEGGRTKRENKKETGLGTLRWGEE